MAGWTGIEPATPGLKVRCSSLTELRAQLFLISCYFFTPSDFCAYPAAPLPQGALLTPVQPSNFSYSINSLW